MDSRVHREFAFRYPAPIHYPSPTQRLTLRIACHSSTQQILDHRQTFRLSRTLRQQLDHRVLRSLPENPCRTIGCHRQGVSKRLLRKLHNQVHRHHSLLVPAYRVEKRHPRKLHLDRTSRPSPRPLRRPPCRGRKTPNWLHQEPSSLQKVLHRATSCRQTKPPFRNRPCRDHRTKMIRRREPSSWRPVLRREPSSWRPVRLAYCFPCRANRQHRRQLQVHSTLRLHRHQCWNSPPTRLLRHNRPAAGTKSQRTAESTWRQHNIENCASFVAPKETKGLERRARHDERLASRTDCHWRYYVQTID